MPFCPACKTEYYPGVTTCADCGVALVASLPQRSAVRDYAAERMQPICEADSAEEGGQIMAVLRQYGIDAKLEHGVVQVLSGDAPGALNLIKEFLPPDETVPSPEDLVPSPGERDATNEDLVPVFEAPDQFLATTVESLLQHEGISATVQSRQMPMYDGLALMQNPVWGKVLVLAPDAGRARNIIQTFLKATAELDAATDQAAAVCPSCGTALRPAAIYCDHCGTKAGEQ